MVFFVKFIVFCWITWVFSPNPFDRGNRFWNKLVSKIMSWSVTKSEGWFRGRFCKANLAVSFFTFFPQKVIFRNRNALGNSDMIYQFRLFHWCRIFYGGNHVLLCNWNRNSFQQRTFEEKSRAQYRVENDEMSDFGRLKYIITSEKSGWFF